MQKNLTILKSLSILYAEDDLVIQGSISRILKMFFKEVYIANDGSEALKPLQLSLYIISFSFIVISICGFEIL